MEPSWKDELALASKQTLLQSAKLVLHPHESWQPIHTLTLDSHTGGQVRLVETGEGALPSFETPLVHINQPLQKQDVVCCSSPGSPVAGSGLMS